MYLAAQKRQERVTQGFCARHLVLCNPEFGPSPHLCDSISFFHLFTSPKELSNISKVLYFITNPPLWQPTGRSENTASVLSVGNPEAGDFLGSESPGLNTNKVIFIKTHIYSCSIRNRVFPFWFWFMQDWPQGHVVCAITQAPLTKTSGSH